MLLSQFCLDQAAVNYLESLQHLKGSGCKINLTKISISPQNLSKTP